MKLPTNFKFSLSDFSPSDFLLWTPALFGFGAIFYFLFPENFQKFFFVFLTLFFSASFLAFLNRHSFRSLIFLGCSVFVGGSFYANFYEKIFLNHSEINGKIYVDAVGKIESIKEFYNPVNGLKGANLVIREPVLYEPVANPLTELI